VAAAVRDGSATLATLTVTVPPVAGAVNVIVLPLPAIDPPLAVHVTAVWGVLLTVAVKSCVPAAPTVTVAGEMEIATGFTVTVADAFLLGSATLVAVTVYGPPLSGAVYVMVVPDPTIVPPLAVH
jgi:hypothetical protein